MTTWSDFCRGVKRIIAPDAALHDEWVDELVATRNYLIEENEDLLRQLQEHRLKQTTLTRRVNDLAGRLQRRSQEPNEYRHALGHVLSCENNCEACRALAKATLEMFEQLK